MDQMRFLQADPQITVSKSGTKSNKVIKHGDWEFDYQNKSNIYTQSIESCDSHRFEHYLNPNTETNPDSETLTTDTNPDSETLLKGRLSEKDLEDFRRAAMIHKIARKKALTMLYSGAKLADLVDATENIIIKMCSQNADPATYFLKGSEKNNDQGIAFPVGVNINNVVAHDSKMINANGLVDDRKFFKGDVVKVDIGVHVNGRIIDSAFTHIVTDKPGVHDKDNIYNAVLEASRESVFMAIKMAGPDQRLDEMSETIQEIIEAHEVEMGGEVLPIRAVEGIGGHNIKQYQIHGGKLILSKPDPVIQGDQRMEEDEVYAIETYATTGFGTMTQNSEINRCTHFMETNHNAIEMNKAITKKDKKFFRQTEFYQWLQTRKGLPFSSSWIDLKAVPKVEKAFKLGIPSGQMVAYPPLFDESNAVVAQFEHTIHANNGSVEVFSLGEDY